jgi:hypothetical protein
MIIIDLCLSDIPAEARKKSEKNQKVYAKFVVDERKSPDNYGNTHTVYVNQTKEEREAGNAKQYVGSGKEIVFGAKTTAKKPDVEQLRDEDDLPF